MALARYAGRLVELTERELALAERLAPLLFDRLSKIRIPQRARSWDALEDTPAEHDLRGVALEIAALFGDSDAPSADEMAARPAEVVPAAPTPTEQRRARAERESQRAAEMVERRAAAEIDSGRREHYERESERAREIAERRDAHLAETAERKREASLEAVRAQSARMGAPQHERLSHDLDREPLVEGLDWETASDEERAQLAERRAQKPLEAERRKRQREIDRAERRARDDAERAARDSIDSENGV